MFYIDETFLYLLDNLIVLYKILNEIMYPFQIMVVKSIEIKLKGTKSRPRLSVLNPIEASQRKMVWKSKTYVYMCKYIVI